MDWKKLKPELFRVLAYFLMYLAGSGAVDMAKKVPGPSAPHDPPACPCPPRPVAPPQPAPPVPLPKVDPEAAIVRITSGGSGCTATIIGPSPREGLQFALSAAHCVAREGVSVSIFHKSGKRYEGQVYRRHPSSDLSLIVFKTNDVLKYAKVAESVPAEGVRIWHMGYGVDRPGNREEGQVIRVGSETSFSQMKISVSSGDSGCGFFRVDNGELVATCYGTDGRGNTIGPGVSAIRAFLKSAGA